jgi:hypothetical protein
MDARKRAYGGAREHTAFVAGACTYFDLAAAALTIGVHSAI